MPELISQDHCQASKLDLQEQLELQEHLVASSISLPFVQWTPCHSFSSVKCYTLTTGCALVTEHPNTTPLYWCHTNTIKGKD
ncbi:hypothetical protein EMCRGX_G011200 [Ephydatia muelleri]